MIIIIGVLILINGLLAALEMALVTVSRTRLKTLANSGNQRATKALVIQNKPGDFLATIQICITLVGTAASAVGGVRIVQNLSPYIARIQGLVPYAEGIALTLVIVAIVYFTLIFGELVPKALALRNAEKITLSLVGPIDILSRLIHLPMRVLTFSTETVLRVIGSTATQHPPTSPEEIEILVRQGTAEGGIQSIEESLISGVFDYTGRSVRDVMTPRTSVVALDVKTSVLEALALAKQAGYSRFPVYHSGLDNVVGYAHIKDIFWANDDTDLRPNTRSIQFIPSGTSLPEAFEIFGKTGGHMAIVIDEYGGTLGLLTQEDLLEEIVGEIEDEHSPVIQSLTQKSDHEWNIAGHSLVIEVAELLNVKFQPKGKYRTIAGFMMSELDRIPSMGDQLNKFGYKFTVREMDHLRVVEVNVSRNR